MGHKVHPKSFRLATIYHWDSKWFARKKYADFLKQDVMIRSFLKKELKDAGVDSVQIERGANDFTVNVIVAKPGLIIGRGGAGAEDLRLKIQKQFFPKTKSSIKLNIQEVSKPGLSAPIVLQAMINDLEKRMPFRRILKQTIGRVTKAGAQGVKVMVSGRLNGAEIARREMLISGKIPLTNLRADIDFASGDAHTIFGVIGVKIWIYRGEIFSAASARLTDGQGFASGGNKKEEEAKKVS